MAERDGGRRRGRQLRRRDARGPLDRRAGRVRDTHALGTYVLLEAARERGIRYVQVSTDEVYGSIEEGSFTEELAAEPVLALQRDQGGRRPAGRLLPPHVRARGADLPRLEQLRAVPVPGEADPADGAQRAARRQAAGLRRRQQVRNWIYAEDFARGIGFALEHGAPGEVYNVGGPDECPNLEVVQRIIEYTGAGDELIEYVTDRPGHDRRYSLSRDKIRELGWEPQVLLRRRPQARPSTGTATTRGGGSRSAPATTARTTSASTAARSAQFRRHDFPRRRGYARSLEARAREEP